MREFIEFLKVKNELENFKKNFNKDPEIYVYSLKKLGIRWAITLAFNWDTSNEGEKHWKKLNSEWNEQCNLENKIIHLWDND